MTLNFLGCAIEISAMMHIRLQFPSKKYHHELFNLLSAHLANQSKVMYGHHHADLKGNHQWEAVSFWRYFILLEGCETSHASLWS
jgi:hypothetical protein